ncbi:MAG: neutral zinc metallopeptidase [Phenylobacterium sp.]|nr:neutral zinc metallopeptidase [Phenylobacterium sp.]
MAVALGSATPAAAATPDEDARLRRRVQTVVESTTQEWSAVFQAHGVAYAAPRVLMLRSPIGHPARGAGYMRELGVVIDLNDMAALDTVFVRNGALEGLVIAHEVGHHVQTMTNPGLTERSQSPELQADCYAGWWLGRAQARNPTDFPLPDLERRLPEMLSLLSVLQAGRLSAASEAEVHGSIPQRLNEVRRGMAAEDPKVCGFSVAGSWHGPRQQTPP